MIKTMCRVQTVNNETYEFEVTTYGEIVTEKFGGIMGINYKEYVKGEYFGLRPVNSFIPIANIVRISLWNEETV